MDEAFIEKLADQLGIAVSTLIDFYAKRAPIVVFEGIVFLLITIPFAWLSYRLFKEAHNEGSCDGDGWFIGGTLTSLVSLILLFCGIFITFQGIYALASPEAYAIDLILGNLH